MDKKHTAAPPQAWLDALHDARDDADAGRTIAAEEVHAKFRERLQGASNDRHPVLHGSDRYAARADRLIDELHNHYRHKGWVEASFALDRALVEAETRIERNPDAGLPAPRPYPELATPGERWIIITPYWVAYRLSTPPLILAVFHDSADIPTRYRP